MKKLVSLILCISLIAALCISFVACNKDETTPVTEFKFNGKTGYIVGEAFESGEVTKYVDGEKAASWTVDASMVSNFDTTSSIYSNWTATVDGNAVSFPYFVAKDIEVLPSEATSVTNNVSYYQNLAYGTEVLTEIRAQDSSQLFDAYIPAKVLNKEVTNPNVLLYVHGGAWMLGSKEEEGASFCQEMAENGFIVVTMNYILQDINKLLANEYFPEASIPNMVGDIGIMVTYLKGFLKTNFNYEPESIAIGGLSAGGHLSSLYAYEFNEYSPINIGFELDIVGPTQFADAGYRAFLAPYLEYDLEKDADDQATETLKNTDPLIATALQNIISNALASFSGLPAESIVFNKDTMEDLWKLTDKYSSLTYVNSSSCPTILAYGKYTEDMDTDGILSIIPTLWPEGVENDFLVPCTCYYEMDKALKNAGVDYVGKLFEGESHLTMNNSTDSRAWIVEQTINFAEKYL